MAEDWAEVAQAINDRMANLDLTQADLVKRSQVSNTMVREIRRNIAERRRSIRTLESLSLALEWHPQHLLAVLQNRPIPDLGEPVVRSDEDIHARLLAIEYRLDQVLLRMDEAKHISQKVDRIESQVRSLMQHIGMAADEAHDEEQ